VLAVKIRAHADAAHCKTGLGNGHGITGLGVMFAQQ
jgi:hypothetical protein